MIFKFNGASNTELNNREIELTEEEIKDSSIATAGDALKYLFDKHIEVRDSYFDSHGELVHGTICIINKVDWEITGREESPLKCGDHVVLISTIHGG
ncbi:ubiquitin-related modifier-like protein [Encephalitozoon hellem ATCC 50504]|uniref:Ubiquitin-related modifier 1 n=1 Tax=Encephalitozoon hellem TaxID=27973 RepID=A0A9Q9F8Z2_ENCHE|nr:ubiquitin-related modifier-like protein [Encephalitozoon hellem ATCC 50504]AFM97967.1 ubiquitin-related modifier-like protein [Encephalitozoon hellem ATCC 50504]UTX42771.1 ubiquitin-related modifier 1 [Encephalitozoon hellem]WEL38230.1 ubiquitin-related modifier 1 [Encephalitozoon hellem]|eukprot:XP_003886948.1 ubiquitin-related modifier-like protein [Encephalitozoon hellem ATCC 50504]